MTKVKLPVKVINIRVDNVDTRDYPDFCDAYISYAEHPDGTPLTDEKLDELSWEYPGLVNEAAHKYFI